MKATTSLDHRCRDFARSLLATHRLSPEERAQEIDALAACVKQAVTDQLENLQHRERT